MENEAFANEALARERKEKAIKFLKSNYAIVTYIILGLIILLSFYIRTANVENLKDITTNTWTLGPDLDPFLFLRWADYINENGTLYSMDTMRYVPKGFETKYELLLHPYLMVWFHKVFSVFSRDTLTYSAIMYPVFMFSAALVFFFLLARKMFADSLGKRKANIIALISSFFLAIIPVILPRTIAGIPEKEASAFPFLFLTFYLFICSWKSQNKRNKYLYAGLAGLSTTAMALVWGGFIYIFITLALVLLISFMLGNIEKENLLAYSIWLMLSFILMNLFSSRFTLGVLISSETTGIAIVALLVCLVHLTIYRTGLKKYFESPRFYKIPRQVISLVVAGIIIFVATSIIYEPSFLFYKVIDIKQAFISPTVSRLGVTVAENRQPFFDEWGGSFGPVIAGKIPVFFWLFLFGAIALFHRLVKPFEKKEKIALTLSCAFFFFAIVFSRYTSSSIFDGTNAKSLLLYFLGFIALAGTSGYYYYKYYKLNKMDSLRSLDFSLLVLFVWFFFSLVSVRGAVRLIMILAPPVSIIVSFFAVAMYSKARASGEDVVKILSWIIFALIIIGLLVSANSFYKESKGTAQNYSPNIYTHQWQKAMEWVRNYTPANAVFGHWWDYGYWLQSIGERATVLDGGNAVSYWNHLMGRYALTGTSSKEAAEFLYAHNTTHFLIDSTDIGKYSAFSSIGSDKDYDRTSWIPSLVRDDSKTTERKNSSIIVYNGGFSVDEDIIYEQNGSRIFLPKGKSFVAAVALEVNKKGEVITNPIGLFVYNNQQYNIPLRYVFDGSLVDFGSGVNSGVYLMPVVSNQNQLVYGGALLYLSPRVANSQLARLYLYGQKDDYFKLVHTEDDLFVAQLKSEGINVGDFVYYQGLRGPIKIWELTYPDNIQYRKEFIETKYPESIKWAS